MHFDPCRTRMAAMWVCLQYWHTQNSPDRKGETLRCGKVENLKQFFIVFFFFFGGEVYFFIFYFFPIYFFISWRLITLQYCSVVFAIHSHESAMDLHVFPSWTPLPIPSLWVFPGHQPQAFVSCIQPGLAICFTLDNIHVLMLFSWNIPPSPSPTESKRLFYKSVSFFFLFCI